MSFPVPKEYDLPDITYNNGNVITLPPSLSGDGTGVNLSQLEKDLILTLFSKAAYAEDDAGTAYDTLENLWTAPQKEVESITAVYTQSGTVYDTDSLDSLKADLVVTANYVDGTSSTIPASAYTLSGTLTEGTSIITVSYAGLTATFSVTVTKGTSYLYNWDFTQSLVDSVSSQTAVLSSIVSAHAPTRDSNGVYIEFNDAYIDLGNIYQPGRTVEIDFGTMIRQGTANGRLLMVGDGSATGGLGTGFIYRSNNTWNWYSGGWDTPISATTDPNYFSEKTLKAVFDSDGHMSVYDGDTLLGTSTKAFGTSEGTSLQIGSYSGNGTYSNFYTMYVKAVRIFENEV